MSKWDRSGKVKEILAAGKMTKENKARFLGWFKKWSRYRKNFKSKLSHGKMTKENMT